MCFKKPKLPAPSAEELAAQAELRAQQEATKSELNSQITREKQRRLEETVARSRGLWGMRSLISGGKGGAGFGSQRSLIG